MITVDRLEKFYGMAQALKGISFEVRKGEVIGFLGPNGAGKSTTMKILTGFLLPSGGRAEIAGLDVVRHSLQVRRHIGYLPEKTPLYEEMRVDEYLQFAAAIRGVPGRRVKSAVDRVVSLCGLSRMVGKNIVELSKGYRQRTGLAQAMIHEPDVLILDEPTSGLDPNQIVEVRSLIEQLGREHTVILSTHYLQEVEKSASQIVIISQGRIVANDTIPRLIAQLPPSGVRATVSGAPEDARAQLASAFLGCELRVDGGANGRLTFEVRPSSDQRIEAEQVAKVVQNKGWRLQELVDHRGTLEDVFRRLTLSESKEAGDA